MRGAFLRHRRRHVRSPNDFADAAADVLPYGIADTAAFARAVDSPSSRPINSASSRSNDKSVAVSDVDADSGADGCPRASADADADGLTFVRPDGRPGACADADTDCDAERGSRPAPYANTDHDPDGGAERRSRASTDGVTDARSRA